MFLYLVNQNRFYTLEECLLIQGFPKSFKLTNNYTEALKQIDNSVSVPVINSLVQQKKKKLSRFKLNLRTPFYYFLKLLNLLV